MNVYTKKIESIVSASKLVPMWGEVPNFPWDEFTEKLKTSLEIEDLTLNVGKSNWRDQHELTSGLGADPTKIAINLTPLTDPCFLVIPQEDLTRLSTWMLGSETFTDQDLQKGFFEFATLHALASTDQLAIFHQLSPKIDDAPFTKQSAYTVDVALMHQSETIWCRLVLPESFHSAILDHYKNHMPPLHGSPVAQEASVTIALNAGRVSLDLEDFKEIEVGDFVLLDQTTYHPSTEKGMLQLTLEGTPLFQVKLKDGELKVLDFAVILEDSPMDEMEHEEEAMAEHQEEMMSETGDEMVAQQEELSAVGEVPLEIVVEVSRMKMNLDKLLSLKPGNVLDCGLENSGQVNLTVGGKIIARGELIEVGDMVGVKIDEVG
ncbi:MAG: hypothetical protein SP1CHLAM54_17420 [Chlamydiia bacterium]|nr:hypothetical protein [Chlamydiia bacterium]MCH9616630.1 hypothetical protein [Chlamydiia bacterium]MCH9629361.1 hypothetical protein [Chlamydiia bacterium]